jgi:hypothetical protein
VIALKQELPASTGTNHAVAQVVETGFVIWTGAYQEEYGGDEN